MSQPEMVDALVLGSGEGGKYLAWHLARSGQRTVVIERRWIGGSCPNINCLPSKNEIWKRQGRRPCSPRQEIRNGHGSDGDRHARRAAAKGDGKRLG